MADNIQISDLQVAKTGTVTVAEGSVEAFLLSNAWLKTSGATVSNFNGGGNIEVSNSGLDPYLISETANDISGPSDIPQLSDVSVFKKELYVNSVGVTKARVILKVNNSSGKYLLGVDTKIINLSQTTV
jgi:hypothetical protein